ncbi:MAG: sel1 repeat family protein [Deltaproteobacteria bacterium]|nr:sel1 repeat family protein [Deltaproteobacteria bacterium]
MVAYRGFIAAAGLWLVTACGPANVQLVKAQDCDGGNLKDCRERCDQNVPRACYRLGWFHERGQGVARDIRSAVSLYQKACDAGMAISCRALAIIYARGGDEVPADKRKAAQYYEEACKGGVLAACPDRSGLVAEPEFGDLGIKVKAPEAPALPQAPTIQTPTIQAPTLQTPSLPSVPQPSVPQPTLPTPGL